MLCNINQRINFIRQQNKYSKRYCCSKTKYNYYKIILLKRIQSSCFIISEWFTLINPFLFLFKFFIIFLMVQLSFQQQTEDITTTVDPKKLPPSIYQWIEENAHICTIVPTNGENLINFLSIEEGAKCMLCPEVPAGKVPKSACAVEFLPNEIDLNIQCHSIPELCVLELHNRYAEYLESGGKIPKISQPLLANISLSKVEDDFFESENNPFNNSTVQFTNEIIIPTDASTLNTSLISESVSQKRIINKKINEIDEKNLNEKDLKANICSDKHELCCFWAMTGECETNPFWMRVQCAKTCGTCNCDQNADFCVSTGIKCHTTTTTSTTTTTTTTPFTTTPSPTTELTTILSTISVKLFKGRNRIIQSKFKPRLRRPPLPPFKNNKKFNINNVDYPPGNQPNRPPSIERFTTTTTTPFTTITTTLSPIIESTTEMITTTFEACVDFNHLCSYWADNNQCDENPFWMRPHCQKSCNSCGETIEDIYAPITKPGCINKDKFCSFWAYIGECSRNPRWMLLNCRASCKNC